jgi:small ubiquitin-related modifier
MAENNGTPPADQSDQPQAAEHLNIKVTDGNNEVFFKIKRSTQLKKLMDAFCERQGKSPQSVRFLFDGQRVNATDTPDTVSPTPALSFRERDRDTDGEFSWTWWMVTLWRFIKSRLVVVECRPNAHL